jgi:hypothetical protein
MIVNFDVQNNEVRGPQVTNSPLSGLTTFEAFKTYVETLVNGDTTQCKKCRVVDEGKVVYIGTDGKEVLDWEDLTDLTTWNALKAELGL